jgi:hypothetical protein
MDMKQKVHPILAVVLGLLVLLGVGWVSMRIFGPAPEQQVMVKPDNPDDPRFKMDPKLAEKLGGGPGSR